jgi:hypothetical protein
VLHHASLVGGGGLFLCVVTCNYVALGGWLLCCGVVVVVDVLCPYVAVAVHINVTNIRHYYANFRKCAVSILDGVRGRQHIR